MKCNNHKLFRIAALTALMFWTYESKSSAAIASKTLAHVSVFLQPTLHKMLAAAPFFMPSLNLNSLKTKDKKAKKTSYSIHALADTMVPRIALSSLVTMALHSMQSSPAPLSKMLLAQNLAWGIMACGLQQMLLHAPAFIAQKLQSSDKSSISVPEPMLVLGALSKAYNIDSLGYGAAALACYYGYGKSTVFLALGASTLQGVQYCVRSMRSR